MNTLNTVGQFINCTGQFINCIAHTNLYRAGGAWARASAKAKPGTRDSAKLAIGVRAKARG